MTKKIVTRALVVGFVFFALPVMAFLGLVLLSNSVVNALACGDGTIALPPLEVVINQEERLDREIMIRHIVMDDEQLENARIIIGVGLSRLRNERDVESALLAALEHSNLEDGGGNDENGYGPFRFDPNRLADDGTPYWGTSEQLQDPVYSANRFYFELEQILDRGEMDTHEATQAVMNNEDPDTYFGWRGVAGDILKLVDDDPFNAEPMDWSAIGCYEDDSQSVGNAKGLAAAMEAAGYSNGKLPQELLTYISERCQVTNFGGADQQWSQMQSAANQAGVDIEGGYCYRTYEVQKQIWDERKCRIPGNCDGNPFPPTAFPGTSTHGWGLAVDVWGASNNTLGCESSELFWLVASAPDYGWMWPEWAHCDKSSREAWHWEFSGVPKDPIRGPPTTQTPE